MRGVAYVTGFTASTDFPTTPPTQQAFGGGAYDAFVAVLNPAGSGAIYSSYLGGSGIDSGFGIASNLHEGLSVVGQTNSRDLSVFNAFQSSYGGDPSKRNQVSAAGVTPTSNATILLDAHAETC